MSNDEIKIGPDRGFAALLADDFAPKARRRLHAARRAMKALSLRATAVSETEGEVDGWKPRSAGAADELCL
jgi:hypothetical protein